MRTKTHMTLPAVVYKIEMASSSRKRPRSDSPSSISSKSRHKIGYNPNWKTDFPWHIQVYGSSGSDSDSSVVGLLCSTCKLHRTKQRNHAGNWTDLPCKSLRRDVLQRHKESSMHKEALEIRERWRDQESLFQSSSASEKSHYWGTSSAILVG